MTSRSRRAPWRTLRRVVRRTALTAVELVLPITCAGCACPAVRLCAGCARSWARPPRRCEDGAARWDWLEPGGPPPVWALAVNAGDVRRLVVAWKDGGRADLTPWLGEVARRAGRWLVDHDDGALAPGDGAPGAPVLVVPAPASPAGARRRGEDLVARVAGAVAQGLRTGGVPARSWPVLRLDGGGDQTRLGARGRAANRAGRVRVRRPAPLRRTRAPTGVPPGARVLLVDDVLTTGSTLAECRRTLEARGARVVGALVLAVTLLPGAQVGRLETRADQG